MPPVRSACPNSPCMLGARFDYDLGHVRSTLLQDGQVAPLLAASPATDVAPQLADFRAEGYNRSSWQGGLGSRKPLSETRRSTSSRPR